MPLRDGALLLAMLLSGVACSPSTTEVPTTEVPEPEAPAAESRVTEEPLAEAPGVVLDPPATRAALAPNLTVVDGSIAATWLEPYTDDGRSRHRLRFSLLQGEEWSVPVTIAAGENFFANWADLPGVVEMGEGTLLAHWLAKTGDDTYAYSIFLARSTDGGLSWRAEGRLNADSTLAEHGFVSWVVEDGGARAFWLDGREMPAGGSMAVRTAHVGEVIGPEEVLDERTCECCSTAAARLTSGPVVVYRDRSAREVRDIGIVRREGDSWSRPERVHEDGWRIEGCPVNGPEIAARDNVASVAWFTGAGVGPSGSVPGSRSGRNSGPVSDLKPAVKVAFSKNNARSFGEPLIVDASAPIGRVDVTLDDAGTAWISWMLQAEGGAEVRLRQVDSSGPLGESLLVATTSASRAAGVPRLEHLNGFLYVCWVEIGDGEPSRLRLRRYPAA